MLALSVRKNGGVMIGNDFVVKVSKVHGNKVTLVFEAPEEVSILRLELVEPQEEESQSSR